MVLSHAKSAKENPKAPFSKGVAAEGGRGFAAFLYSSA
jgi:hypothetical protein